MAAVDYFLKIDGIEGESQDSKHKNEIDIESFSWGLTQSGSAAHAGAGAGKAAFNDFSFVTPVSKASPKLFLACASGQHIPWATFTARRTGEQKEDLLTITMTDLLVSSYQSAGDAGADVVPVDSFSFNFSKIEFEYVPQGPDGRTEAPVKAGWDLKKNEKV